MVIRTSALCHLFATSSAIVLIAPAAQAQVQAYDLNIPARDLDGALKALSSATGQQVAFRGAVVRGKRSPALKGRYTIDQAFDALLAGSGLAIKRISGGVFVIEPAPLGNEGNGDAGSGEDIVVTGSNIRGGNPESPVITITRKDIDRSGYSTAGDLIKNLPQSSAGGQNFNVRGSSNPAANGNYSAISSANLRGLGSDATLTLVNGRRLAYGGLFNGVDISAIPFGAIDRVEVLTDGASSIYGSDAVGGVVNFILRKRFDGALTTLRTGISSHGDGAEYQANQLAGTSWSSGAILGSYEYYQQEPIYASDRSFAAAAPAPNSIVPAQTKHSAFLSFRQDLTPRLTFSVNGLYSARNSDNAASTRTAITQIDARERQYGITPQLEWKLGHWLAKIAVDNARDRQASDLPSIIRTTRAVSPFSLRLENSVTNYEAQASGPLLALSGGDIQLALGGGHRSEHLDYRAAPANATSAYGGGRTISYGYGEIRIPLISDLNGRQGVRSLELSGSARYEDYSDFGENLSPKIGISYKPNNDLKLRATWSRSFKAPLLTQYLAARGLTIYPAGSFVAGAPAGSVIAIQGGANPNLKPEKATSITAGFDYAPGWAPGLRLGSTYFLIKYDDRISTPIASIAGAYTNPIYAPYVDKNPTAEQYQNLLGSSTLFQNYAGPFVPAQIIAIYHAQWQNLYRQTVSGFDFTGSYDFTVANIKANVFGNMSFLNIRQRNLPTLPEATITGTIFNPSKFRARGGIQAQGRVVGMSLIVNHIGPEIDNSNNFNTAALAKDVPVSPMTTVDAQVVFGSTAPESSLGGYQLSFGVLNLFDKKPPSINPTSGTVNNPGFGYDTANYSPVGRYASVTVSKRW